MDIQAHDKGVRSFGPFRIDCARRQLTCDGETIRLTPRLFDALAYFVDNPGRVVEKDELMQAVWRGRIVEEANLSQAIFALRKVLREGGVEEAIATAPGRGYRFVLPVHNEPAAIASGGPLAWPPVSTEPATVETVPMPGGGVLRHRRRLLPGVLALAVVCVGGLLYGLLRHAPPAEPAFAPPPHSVAVLAFANMSGDPSQTWFSDGLSEELINELARVGSLRVAARTSAFSFRDSHATISDIGRRLNVGAVLEGSVRRDGNRIRVAANLIDASTGFMLWTHVYDSDQGGALKLQTDIANSVAEALRVTLGSAEAGQLGMGGTHNPAAFDAFLHGINAEHTRTEAGFGEARQQFEQAVGLDPQYAEAHAGLSKALNWLASSGTSNDVALVKAMKERALSEANRAIALAPGLADGYEARARVLEDQLEFGEAYDAIRRAAELGPGNAGVLQYYGQFASRMGHTAEGEAAERRGAALDPLSGRSFMGLAVVNLIDRRYDDALEALQHMATISGGVPPIAVQLQAVIALKRGEWQRAVSLAEQTQGWPQAEYLAIAYHALGRQAEADAAFAKLQGLQGENSNFQYAEVYAQWGETDRALAALDAAFRERDAGLVDLRSSLFLDPIRSTPRYAALLQALHMPP